MAEVSIRGVSKRYPSGNLAVADLSLQLEEGKLLALVGPSGSGKTTLLRLLAGLEAPSSGTIFFGKEDVTRWPPHQRQTAVVFQTPGLYPHWSVRKNLELGLQPTGGGWYWQRRQATSPVLSASSVRERIEKVARVLGIDSLLDRFPTQLSGGEQQRVALGRGLVQEPAVLLLDEPFAHLDGVLRRELRDLVRSQQRSLGTTTLLVTHDPAEALAVSDRLAVIHQGRLLQVSSPQEIYDLPDNPEVARWGGPLGMNLWQGQVVEMDGGAWFSAEGWQIKLPSQLTQRVHMADEVLFGVRPEQISFQPGEFSTVGKVESQVFVGDGWLVQASLEQGKLALVRVPRGEVLPAVGERVQLSVRGADAHWFSATRGKRLI